MRHPLRVVSVEDDPKDARLIQDLLETEGIVCEITRVDTQASLLDLLQEYGVDLILADFRLPRFDGLRALRRVQERGLDIPFIVVSGALGDELAARCIKEGVTDYLLKDRILRLGPAVEATAAF